MSLLMASRFFSPTDTISAAVSAQPFHAALSLALRILPSSHTNPVFVLVDGKPIRASKRSAEWCLAGVKKCRSQKQRFMGADEIADFNAAYDHAEKTYRRIIAESVTD